MNVFVTPLEVMNYSFVSQLLFYYENVLEEIDYAFFDVEMIEFGYHSFLVFQVSFILVY